MVDLRFLLSNMRFYGLTTCILSKKERIHSVHIPIIYYLAKHHKGFGRVEGHLGNKPFFQIGFNFRNGNFHFISAGINTKLKS